MCFPIYDFPMIFPFKAPFFARRCNWLDASEVHRWRLCAGDRAPKRDNLGPYTEQAKPMGEIQPVVPCFLQSISVHIIWHPTHSLPLSLSLTQSFLWQISFEQCHSDNHLLHSVPGPSHRAISITLERWISNMLISTKPWKAIGLPQKR